MHDVDEFDGGTRTPACLAHVQIMPSDSAHHLTVCICMCVLFTSAWPAARMFALAFFCLCEHARLA